MRLGRRWRGGREGTAPHTAQDNNKPRATIDLSVATDWQNCYLFLLASARRARGTGVWSLVRAELLMNGESGDLGASELLQSCCLYPKWPSTKSTLDICMLPFAALLSSRVPFVKSDRARGCQSALHTICR